MIVLLSPAKTLDETPVENIAISEARLLKESGKLVRLLRKKSVGDLQELMSISEKLAQLNVDRYKSYKTPFTLENAKPAALLFKGDVYTGLEADSFDEADLEFAQDHIRILSGLYGILRPLDLVQPYRLEMGTRLENGKFSNLYQFWDKRITKLINEDLQKTGEEVVLNLASQEYFKAVKPDVLKGRLIHVHFKEDRNGKLKVISFNAKKARGRLANLIVKERVTDVESIKTFSVDGYEYQADLSSETDLVFVK